MIVSDKQGELTMLKEFKDFAMKGNMLDMAIGVIIGGASGKSSRRWSATY